MRTPHAAVPLLLALAGACAGDRPAAPDGSVASLRLAFPSVAGWLAEARDARAVRLRSGGFALPRSGSSTRSSALGTIVRRRLDVELPATAAAPFTLALEGEPLRVRVRRLGDAAVPGAIEGGAVVYASPESARDEVLVRRGDAVEELVVVKRAGAEPLYELDLPGGFHLDGGRFPGLVEVKDARGLAWMRVQGTAAWDAGGVPVAVQCVAQGNRIALRLGPVGAYPVIVDPTWSTSANDLVPRRDHTATALSDGQVLVAGGEVLTPEGTPDPNQVVTPAELFDPDTGTFTVTGALLTPRRAHTATLLPDGTVLLAGGIATDPPGAVLASTEIYDPSKGSFSSGPSLPTPRAAHTATLLPSGSVLVSAPRDTTIPGSTSRVDVVSSTAGVLASATMIHGRSDYTATLLPDGDVLFVGDRTDPSLPAEVFDPLKSAFHAVAAPLSPRGCAAAVLLSSGDVLVAGGGCAGAEASAELYDPATGTFTPTGSLATARASFAANLLPNGQVLVTGGDAPGPLATAELYDPVSGTFTQQAMPDARDGHTATALATGGVLLLGGRLDAVVASVPVDTQAATPPPVVGGRRGGVAVLLGTGKVLLAGGIGAGTVDAEAELYDPVANAFSFAAPSPRPLHDPAVAVLASGQVLLAGGTNAAGEVVAASSLYDPATSSFAPTGPLTTARARAATVSMPDGAVLVLGGVGSSGQPLASTETFLSATRTFGSGRPMHVARSGHVAIRLLDGTVLIAGGESGVAEIYDPSSIAFRLAKGAMIAPRTRPFATLLGSGEVLFAGPDASTELFDPSTETFRAGPTLGFTGAVGVIGALLPTGRVLLQSRDGSSVVLYDPSSGGVVPVAAPPGCVGDGATLLPTGSVLVAGCQDATAIPALWSEFGAASPSRLPSFTTTPASVRGGDTALLGGERFTTTTEGGSGATSQSASNSPLVSWIALSGSGLVRGRVTSWTDAGATWMAPTTALSGPGLLFPATGAGVGRGRLVALEPSQLGTPCSTGHDCAAGFCVDGVCCDSACEAVCTACTSVRKGGGLDGRCGPIPEGVPNPGCAKDATSCGQNGACDGAGSCAIQPLGTPCGNEGVCVQGMCSGSKCTSNADCAADEVCFTTGSCARPDATPGAVPSVGCAVSRVGAQVVPLPLLLVSLALSPLWRRLARRIGARRGERRSRSRRAIALRREGRVIR